MRKGIFILYLIGLLLVYSCTSKNRLEYALDFAGDNRVELEKVLKHYEDSGYKYRAACFLIENMPRYYYYEGPLLDSVKQVKASILKRMISSKVKEKWEAFNYHNLTKIYDAHVITADYLIDNIDRAFSVWEKRPWGKYVSFDEFCELILPYRIADEPLERWRDTYCKQYEPVLDSLYKGTNVVSAVDSLVGYVINTNFKYNTYFTLPHLGPSFLMKYRIGKCEDACDYLIYLMRSLGIPVAIDFYHYSPTFQHAHYWNVVKDTTGAYIPFWLLGEFPQEDKRSDGRRKGKVYRMHFGSQEKNIPRVHSESDIPSFLKNPYFKDVTENYFGKNETFITIDPSLKNKDIYLSVFSPKEWVPVGFAENQDGVVRVTNIEPTVIYQLVYMDKNKLAPAGYPFSLHDSVVTLYRPDTCSLQKVGLTRKYPLAVHIKDYMDQVIGARIEGDNSIEFKRPDLLYTIKESPASNRNIAVISSPRKYRYIRYVADKKQRVDVAELEFYRNLKDERKIRAKVIAGDSPLFKNERNNMHKMNDGDYLTFAFLKQLGGSVTFDLGVPEKIEKILYAPRNDENFVNVGDVYELFYQNGISGWKSLGKKEALENILPYDNVPANALLWLRNLTTGNEEQVFWIEDGKQKFLGGIDNWQFESARKRKKNK